MSTTPIRNILVVKQSGVDFLRTLGSDLGDHALVAEADLVIVAGNTTGRVVKYRDGDPEKITVQITPLP